MINQKSTIFLIFLMLGFDQLDAQDVGAVAMVSKPFNAEFTIGNTKVGVKYHSPSVNGRKIFGGIVPFDFVVDGKEYAWRAGSNQRTRIEFEHDVLINGKSLPAGDYGFVVLVSEKEWTMVFSKDKTWGAFQYDPTNDILRVPVKAEAAPFQEWLSYDLVERKAESARLELRWEKTKAGFTVEVDVLSNALNDFAKKEDKTSGDYLDFAKVTLRKDPSNKEEALKLVNKSVEIKKGFLNQIFKADLLISMGNQKEGNLLKTAALDSAKGYDIYYYGLSLQQVDGNGKEALKVLMLDTKRNPTNFATYLALGEYYQKVGNQKEATDNFKKAFEHSNEKWKNYTRYLYLQNKLILKD